VSTQAPEPRPGAEDWTDALARIEASLERALAQTPEPPEPPGADPPAGDGTSGLDGCLEALRAALERAERAAREVESVLAEHAAACEDWLKAAAGVRARLAQPSQ
jgi:hypothetical protein